MPLSARAGRLAAEGHLVTDPGTSSMVLGGFMVRGWK